MTASARRASAAADVEMLPHQIPTPGAKPYIVVVRPDRQLWFCENGAAKIGRLDVDTHRFAEFAVATPAASLRGVAVAPDGDLWLAENLANTICRMSPAGDVIGEVSPRR